jgi:glycerophosphoryl diester phosphodiesterase
VIGHRGAPGYRPENTLASFSLAIALGADALETDVVMTADGVPVLRHERDLGLTTDGEGLLVEEVTLAELKRLRCRERWPERRARSARWDGHLEVATLDELLLLLAEQPRAVELHLELKDPDELAAAGLGLEDAVLATLRDHGLDGRPTRPGRGVVLSSFTPGCLHRLRDRTDLPLVQLVDGDDPVRLDLDQPAGGIGIAVSRALAEPELVERAHRAGMGVTAWTVRDDDPGGAERADAQVRRLLDLGIDGLFTDHPDTTLLGREVWSAGLTRPVGAA